jgi:surfactin synthase thioesterase subunit
MPDSQDGQPFFSARRSRSQLRAGIASGSASSDAPFVEVVSPVDRAPIALARRTYVCWQTLSDAYAALVCLPWAGSGAGPFRPWGEWLAPEVETWAVRLPGRESRLAEEPIDDLAQLVGELADELPVAPDRPFSLFGHCSGALIAVELAYELRRRGGREPSRLFLASHEPVPARLASRLESRDMREVLAGLGPASEELVQHEELLELMRPAIEADVRVAESWDPRPRPPLSIPISVLAGDADEALDGGLLGEWRRYTTAEFTITAIEGDHFLSGPAWRRLADAVAERMRSDRSPDER